MKMELPILPPVDVKPAWEGQFNVFSWYSFVINIPNPVFIVTTLKENGLANAQLSAWGMMIGSGAEPKFLLQVMKCSDTYELIKENKEFVINYPSFDLRDSFINTTAHYGTDIDEIVASGLQIEESKLVSVPRVRECFAHLECVLDWVRDVEENSDMNALIQGQIVNAAIDESVLVNDLKESYERRDVVFNIQEPINPITNLSQESGAFCKLDIKNSARIGR